MEGGSLFGHMDGGPLFSGNNDQYNDNDDEADCIYDAIDDVQLLVRLSIFDW